MVDEYQDISPLQEALLAAVSITTPGDRFMVGGCQTEYLRLPTGRSATIYS